MLPEKQDPNTFMSRDPQIIQWEFVRKFLDPTTAYMLTEYTEAEVKTMSKHKAFIRHMTQPLYIEDTDKDGKIRLDSDGKAIMKPSPPIAAEEAFHWLTLYRVSLDRKGRAELLKAIGRTVVNFTNGTGASGFNTGMADEPEPRKKFLGIF